MTRDEDTQDSRGRLDSLAAADHDSVRGRCAVTPGYLTRHEDETAESFRARVVERLLVDEGLGAEPCPRCRGRGYMPPTEHRRPTVALSHLTPSKAVAAELDGSSEAWSRLALSNVVECPTCRGRGFA